MIVDQEVAIAEWNEIEASLRTAGIVFTRFQDLRETRPEYRAALPILWSALRRVKSRSAACELMWAIAGQTSDPGEIRELIRFAKPLRGISFDLYTQLRYYRYLRGEGFKGRPPTAEELKQAQHAVESGWYRSYERPVQRGPVRVHDPTFPDREILEIDAESDVFGMGLGNVLLWRADPRLFDDVAEMLLDTRLGFGRSLLPDALAKCDRHRAAEILMSVLNDPDIGADAIEPLGKLKYQPARPYIERFLDHPIERVRKWATVALRRLDQAAGRRAAARVPFEEVLPESERKLGAELVAAEGEEPRDFKGEVSAFVIGCLAEEERGWTREQCFSTSVELDEVESTMRKLGRAFKGDFAGRRGKALREEILQAEHEDRRAYKLQVQVAGRTQEVWFHYFLDDPSTVDIALWGPPEFIGRVRSLLPQE